MERLFLKVKKYLILMFCCCCYLLKVALLKHNLHSIFKMEFIHFARTMEWLGFPPGSGVKNLLAVQESGRSHGFDPWVGKIPWRRNWQPTPVFLPGESHGQRSLMGYIQSMGSQRVGHDLASKQQQQFPNQGLNPGPWL